MNPTLRNYVVAALLGVLLIIAAATATREYLNSHNGPARYGSAFFLSGLTSATLCV